MRRIVLGRFSNCVYFMVEPYGLYAGVPHRRGRSMSATARYFVRTEGRVV